MSERIEACLNCATPLEGVWCPHCGQANRRSRLSPNDLAHDAFDQLVGLDTRIGRTLVDFTLRPGQAALAYVRGHRARYVNPLKYMLFSVAAYFIALKAFGLSITELSPQRELPADADPMVTELTAELLHIINDGLRALLFIAPPIFAWTTGWFLGREHFASPAIRFGGPRGLIAWTRDFWTAPRHFNFAESCSLWLHVFAHVIVICTLPALCLVAAGFRTAIYWATLPTFAYYAWAARRFYRRGWIYSTFMVLFSYFAFLVIWVGGLFISVLVAAGLSR